MKRLENLPEIATRQLGGLEATPQLMAKIKLNAAEPRPQRAMIRWQPIAAACAVLVLLMGGGWLVLGQEGTEKSNPGGGNVIDSHSAGLEVKVTETPAVSADVPYGSITMSSGGSQGSSLFAEPQGSSFPLVTVGRATYRLLTSPNAISGSLLGTSLGTIDEYNVEPALGSGDRVSNIVAQGEEIFALSGMDGAMIGARVNGDLRVFQRVSYAGTAIVGSETLANTLCSSGDVQWLELSGVGYVQGSDAQTLMDTLLRTADYQSTGMTGSGSLQVGLNNGLSLQLLVGDDTVSACGTWSCPEFFEAFHEAVGQ